MHNIAVYLTDCLIQNEIAPDSRREEYVYGLEVMIGKIINYSTLLLIAIISGTLVPSIFFMITFFSLRGRTGGFHARTPLQCYIGTIIIYLLIIYVIAPLVEGKTWVYAGILVFSWLIIWMFAPVNHPDLDLDNQEIEECRKSARWLLLLITLCMAGAVALNVKAVCIAYWVVGIGMDTILVCIAKILRQEVRKDEE